MKPVVIFVDDETKILKGLQRILLNKEEEWEMKFFSKTSSAMDFLNSTKTDVVVSDINMPDITGVEFIQRVKEKHPCVKRIIVSGTNDRNLTAQASKFAHQFFPKPYDTKTLVATIINLIEAEKELKNQNVAAFINSLGEMPLAPGTYTEIEEELKSGEYSLGKITTIISKNPVIVAKILHLANSAFFGVKGKITNIVQAINFLGLNIIKSLVLCIEIFYKIKGFDQKYIDYLWNHSFSVARLSKEIMQSINSERMICDMTYTAGLLHDIGKIILLEFQEYRDFISEFKTENYDPGVEAEKGKMGFSHAEAGGYLLDIWGFPEEIVNIVGNHHLGNVNEWEELNPTIAVYLANEIVKYKNEPEKITLSNKIKTEFLTDEKLENWINLAIREGYE